jgi:uncharacterized protein involved in exopolysaccharide biosynthesis
MTFRPAPREVVLFDSTAEGAPGHGERAGAPIEARRLLGAARRGARVLAVSTAISGLSGLVLSKAGVLSEYEATMLLQLDPEKGSGEDEARELATVVGELKLPANLAAARARLGLAVPLPALGRRVSVASTGDSNVVTVKTTAASGVEAERLADALATAFFEHRVAAAKQRFEEQARALAANIERARADVLAARNAYRDLLAEHGVADLAVEVKAAVEQAARLRAEAQLARADSEAEAARADSLGAVTRAEGRTAVLQQMEIVPDARRLTEASTELAALRAQLAGDHPRVRALEAQVGALEARVARGAPGATTERTVGRNPQWEAAQQGLHAASAQRDAALQRQRTLAALAAETEAAVARLSLVDAEASKLRPRAKAAEEHLAELELRHARAEDAARAPSSGLRVVSPASVSPGAARPSRALLAIGASLVGLALAAIALLLREARGLRVLAARELSFWSRAPVVAASTWPREPGGLADLITDLGLCFQRAPGVTLFLGLGEREARHARVLAVRLDPGGTRAQASSLWHSPAEIRRAARASSRVIVLVEAGCHDVLAISALRARLGREDGVGLVLLGRSSTPTWPIFRTASATRPLSGPQAPSRRATAMSQRDPRALR